MPEVDEAIGLVCFVWLSVVHDQVEIIEAAFVIFFEVRFDIFFGVSAWYVSNHQVRSALISTHNFFAIDWTTVILLAYA